MLRSLRTAAAASIVGAATAVPAGAEPPSFSNNRADENWGALREPANRTGAAWEALKFMPLDTAGGSFLTIGADLRLRFESYADNFDAAKPNETYGWSRVMPYADLRLGPNLRFFGQMLGAWTDRSALTKGPVDETGVELLQGFAEASAPVGSGELSVRGGRQMVAYGSERLIGLRFGPNVPLSFDGARARLELGGWTADAFAYRPVENALGDFDDRSDRTRKVYGLYATRALPELAPKSGLDLYWIGYGREDARFDSSVGNERRHTFGARFFGSLDDWSWNHEAMLQLGTFGDEKILAWSVATDTRYTFSAVPLQPFVELKANVISGDGGPGGRLGTFNALFPKGKYFGEIGLIGPANLVNLHPAIGVSLGSGWSLTGAAVFYWRQSLDDGVYGNPGNLIRPSGGSRARYVGTQAEVVLGWEATPNVTLETSYALFEPGRFLSETGPGKTVHFVGGEIQFRY
ncbi:alginate export family protein [Methylopila henanensis]|uniref:Alginate export family protein n=1 Tax=Methylopila henanensis TaxID=873516 RepID=A0ABW4KA99_9HYPH